MWNSCWNLMMKSNRGWRKRGGGVWYFVMARLKTDTSDFSPLFFTYSVIEAGTKKWYWNFYVIQRGRGIGPTTEQTKYAFSNACEPGMKFLSPYFLVLVYKQSGKYTILKEPSYFRSSVNMSLGGDVFLRDIFLEFRNVNMKSWIFLNVSNFLETLLETV